MSFWPHHTVAHGTEMTGRPGDGPGWMAAREALWVTPSHLNQVHIWWHPYLVAPISGGTHIWWHKALSHIELGQYEAALALYDGPRHATPP